jgi:MFS family permease
MRDPASEPDPALLAHRVILTLTAANLFLFFGAGAQQQFLMSYLGDLTGWGSAARSGVIAAVYFSMMVFRVVNVWLLRRWPDRVQTIVGSLTYTGFCVAMGAFFFWNTRAPGVVATLLQWTGAEPGSLAGRRVAFAVPYALPVLAALIWGWGGAALWAGSSLQVLTATDRGKARYGSTMGLLYTATHLGFSLGVVVLGWVYALVPRDSLYLLYVVAAGVSLLGNLVLLTTPRLDHVEPERPSLATLLRMMSKAKAVISGFLQFAAALSFGLMLGSFGDVIKVSYGKGWIWLLAAPYPLARLAWGWVSGALSDRLGRAPTLAGSFLFVAAALAACGRWSSPLTLGVASAALGLLGSAVPVIASAIVGDSADRRRRPLAYGSVFVYHGAGIAIAALAGAALRSHFPTFQPVFLIFAGIFAACGLISVLLNRWAEQRL